MNMEIAVRGAEAEQRLPKPSHGDVRVAAARTVGATPATAAKINDAAIAE